MFHTMPEVEIRRPSRTRPRTGRSARPGWTLIELLTAIGITTMVLGALASLTRAVQVSSEYSEGRNNALQHARVTLNRIERMVNEAWASEQFPGAVVFADTQNGWRLPETLVVWHPTGTAVQPDGLPRFSELVVYCPSPTQPERLLEITSPTDTRAVPALTSTATWASELTTLKTGNASKKTLLTELVRTATVGTGSARAAVRFEVERRPTATDWANYRSGTTAWQNVFWVQGVYGSQTGLAQTWVRMELQVLPVRPGGTTLEGSITFFGSAATYYQLHK